MVIVCELMVAPPIVVNAWPMAVLLWQHVENILQSDLHTSNAIIIITYVWGEREGGGRRKVS